MFTIFGYSAPLLFGQLLLGLINGAFYALLSLGLAVIFGMLNIINFAHGALFMVGAFVAWMLQNYLGLDYWWALLLAPLSVGILGILLEKTVISRLYRIDHLYGLVLVAAVTCLAVWLIIDKTSIGAKLRAATENPGLVQAFGVNVPRMITLTYAGGVALAAFAGVLAAPIYSVNPNMGSNLIIVVFAVVVIGGMGSILGSILTGFGLGIAEGLTKVFYPQGSATVVFVVMVIVLLIRPAGLFGKAA